MKDGRAGMNLERLRKDPAIAGILDVPLRRLPDCDVEAALRFRVNVYDWCAEYGREFGTFRELVEGMCRWYSPRKACEEAMDFATQFHVEASYDLAERYCRYVVERFEKEFPGEVYVVERRLAGVRVLLR